MYSSVTEGADHTVFEHDLPDCVAGTALSRKEGVEEQKIELYSLPFAINE